MEFVALAKNGVEVYEFDPDAGMPSKPTLTFPAVQTKEGLEWSADGSMLGLVDAKTGGVMVLNAAAGYSPICQVTPLIGGPVRNFYFSPLGRFVVTHERWVKDAGPNVGVWDAKTGEMKTSFIMKKFTAQSWPPLKWTSLETHCCRLVADGVCIMDGSLSKEGQLKISPPSGRDILTFEVAPRGPGTTPPHVAVCIAESKGQPATAKIYRLDEPEKNTAQKSFFKAQTVTFQWNNTGTGVLCKTQTETDDTGKNYYGGTNLYFLRADGQEDCMVANADEGPVHDVQWSPTQDEFFLLHGVLPCSMQLNDGRKGNKKMEFGRGHRNTIRFNKDGRFVVTGGYGQLLGDTDFWDKPAQKLLNTVRFECCVVSQWAPDGRHFLAATTAPRMRVDNKIVMYDYCGNMLGTMPFEELLNASFRPMARGKYPDRPASPERIKAAEAAKKAASSGGGYPGAKADASKQAYRPPGARGGGGLSALLRQELGSTQATTPAATRAFGSAIGLNRLPPGADPNMGKPGGGGGGGDGGNSRSARRKKAKEAAQAGKEDEAEETPTPAPAAKAAAAPKAAAAASAPAAAGAAGGDGENAEVEKKVRALRKKLRDIEKLKEKADKDLDVLQREKLKTEGDLIQQIRDLGAEP
eukprot:TRINITY_DN31554_c0_g1_i1.p1 TRINITY_DN31554_c0_g1~~TRINITY_DN31554_c0_g1_i1.p1  ORF type:complete len:638 (+),score=197.96 TRINITY_DN31554_c0_g1_i1:136-2049(+)